MSFDVAFDRLIGHEAGYVNDPNDPGGETKWGISKRSYPLVDIKHLTREEAKLFYKRDFWDRMKGDTIPFPVMFQLFDFAVNSGIETAVRQFQKVVGVADDGHWGPISRQDLLGS
jgi:lysozyme family protein